MDTVKTFYQDAAIEHLDTNLTDDVLYSLEPPVEDEFSITLLISVDVPPDIQNAYEDEVDAMVADGEPFNEETWTNALWVVDDELQSWAQGQGYEEANKIAKNALVNSDYEILSINDEGIDQSVIEDGRLCNIWSFKVSVDLPMWDAWMKDIDWSPISAISTTPYLFPIDNFREELLKVAQLPAAAQEDAIDDIAPEVQDFVNSVTEQ